MAVSKTSSRKVVKKPTPAQPASKLKAVLLELAKKGASKAMAAARPKPAKSLVAAKTNGKAAHQKAAPAAKPKAKAQAVTAAKGSSKVSAKKPTPKVMAKAPQEKPTLKGKEKAAATSGKPAPVATKTAQTKGLQKAASHPGTAVVVAAPSKAAAQPTAKGIKAARAAKNAMAATIATVSARLTGRAPIEFTGDAVCREVACEGLGTSAGYCRMHYIKNWKKIKRKEIILKERKLNHYIEELVAKYPDKYIEVIRQDLAHEKDFAKVVRDLDLDENAEEFETEGEGPEVIDNIKRDFEDEGESF